MSNAINPEHYNRLNPQPKDVIRAWGLNFNLGSAVKYISRAGHKDDIVQDLKKAQEFIQFEIDVIEGARAERKDIISGMAGVELEEIKEGNGYTEVHITGNANPIEINDITDIKVMNRRA